MLSLKKIINKLQNNEITSLDLILSCIKAHETYQDKNAIASISPKAIELAKLRDQERKQGLIRGPLHGIPIVIKDNILYPDGTPTTANAYALSDLYPPYQANIVTKLLEAGAIILGKANLSEFAYFMSDENMPSGYGSMYGQVKHPFDEKIDPYGSSTGSAVAVKLGIVPLSIGTETNGSLMAPAYQCQITSFKPSFGLISKHGIIPISPTQDTAGPMANSVYDCALLMDVLDFQDPEDPDTFNLKRNHAYIKDINQPLKNQKIGMIKLQNRAYFEDEVKLIEQSKKRLENLGHKVLEIEIDQPRVENDPTLLIEFKYAINQFLETVKPVTFVKSLKDIILFNKEHQERCLKYGQGILEKAEKTDGNMHSENYLELRKNMLDRARLLEDLMKKHDLVSVVAPFWMGFAPIYGNPSVCIPEGIFSGVPKAMVFVGRKYDDKRLLQLTHQYQKTCEIK
jgi:amidase